MRGLGPAALADHLESRPEVLAMMRGEVDWASPTARRRGWGPTFPRRGRRPRPRLAARSTARTTRRGTLGARRQYQTAELLLPPGTWPAPSATRSRSSTRQSPDGSLSRPASPRRRATGLRRAARADGAGLRAPRGVRQPIRLSLEAGPAPRAQPKPGGVEVPWDWQAKFPVRCSAPSPGHAPAAPRTSATWPVSACPPIFSRCSMRMAGHDDALMVSAPGRHGAHPHRGPRRAEAPQELADPQPTGSSRRTLAGTRPDARPHHHDPQPPPWCRSCSTGVCGSAASSGRRRTAPSRRLTGRACRTATSGAPADLRVTTARGRPVRQRQPARPGTSSTALQVSRETPVFIETQHFFLDLPPRRLPGHLAR